MGRERNRGCSGWDNSQCEGTPYCPPRCPRFVDRESEVVLVEPQEPGDTDALVDMYLGLGPENRTMGLPPATDTGVRRWLGRFLEDGWGLVASLDGTVVGHAGVTPGDATEPHLIVFVADAAQGRGIGSELVRQLAARGAARGHEALVLTVDRRNDAAITVYDNVGFDVIEHLGGEIEMQLSLGDPVVEEFQRPPAQRDG